MGFPVLPSLSTNQAPAGTLSPYCSVLAFVFMFQIFSPCDSEYTILSIHSQRYCHCLFPLFSMSFFGFCLFLSFHCSFLSLFASLRKNPVSLFVPYSITFSSPSLFLSFSLCLFVFVSLDPPNSILKFSFSSPFHPFSPFESSKKCSAWPSFQNKWPHI